MVRQRDGDEINLLDSSIRTTGGALFSTALYVISGIVYAAVTSPSATGTYFFITISVALVLRPIRGVTQALRKIGSERGEDVGVYFSITLLFVGLFVPALGVIVFVFADTLAATTAFDRTILGPTGLYALSAVLLTIVTALTSAIGYPSAETWLTGSQSAVHIAAILAIPGAVSTAGDLMVVVAGVRFALFVPVLLVLGVVPARPDRRAVRRVWAFAKWSVPDQILDRFSYNMPVYVLGVVATPVAVGIYEAADRFADFGATISWRLSTPLLTKVSGDSALGETELTYLSAAVTGGTGVTFVVFAYLLAAHQVVAAIAFPATQRLFSLTVLLVGGVNILRGFWTLVSHAMEGLGKPSVSARTKLYGLVLSVPVTVVLGREFGAIAGGIGYTIMNVAIFAYVVYYATDVLDGVPLDTGLAAKLTASLLVSFGLTAGSVSVLTTLGLSPVAVAGLAAVVCLTSFSVLLTALSARTRIAVGRAADLYLGVRQG
jgi:O-antigen/teichoic acid export membrane protein